MVSKNFYDFNQQFDIKLIQPTKHFIYARDGKIIIDINKDLPTMQTEHIFTVLKIVDS